MSRRQAKWQIKGPVHYDALVDEGSVSGNFDLPFSGLNSYVRKLTLAGDLTLTFTDPALDGILLVLFIKQDAVGGHTIDWSGVGIDSDPTLGTDPDDTTVVLIQWDGTSYYLVNAVVSGSPSLVNDSVTNAFLANMAAWRVKMRNAATTGDPQDVYHSDLTEETDHDDSHQLLGWNASGLGRRFDTRNLGPLVNVKYHGATGDGATDDTTAIQAALDAADGKEVYVPAGQYRVNGLAWNEDNDLKITGPGVLLVAGNTNGLEIDMPLGAAQTVSSVSNVNSSTAANSPTVSQLSVTGHGWVRGDVIKLISNGAHSDVKGITSIKGEICTVMLVVDANTVRVNKQLESISTSEALVVARKLSSRKVDLDVRVAEFGSQVTPHSGSPWYVRVSGAVEPNIRIRAKTAHHNILSLDCCLGGTADVSAQEADDDESNAVFGYGIRLGGASVGTKVTVNGGPFRHAFTTKDADGTTFDSSDESKFYVFGRAIDCVVHDSVVVGCHRAAFDTHPLAQRIRFENCHAIHSGISDETNGSLPIGFQLRGRDLTLSNCSSVGGRYGCLDISTSGQKGTWFTRIDGCDFRNNRLRAFEANDSGFQSGDTKTIYLNDSVLEARSACMIIENADLYANNVVFRYTGFSHITQIDSANRTSTVHLNNCRWNHTTNNNNPDIEVNAGTVNLRIRNADTFLAANVNDFLINVGASGTCNLDAIGWTYNTNRTISGLIGGNGTIGTLANTDATARLNKGNVTGAVPIDMRGMFQPTITATLTADTTFSFNDPSRACKVTFIITQDATGYFEVTWPTILGPTPQVDPTPNSVTVIVLEFDGTNYHHFGTAGS